jgi:SNF2 family DNA or RNA helicase
MRTYTQMEDLLIAQINEGVVTAATAASASIKLRQIVNGGIYRDPLPGSAEKREVAEIHTAKVDALKDLVDELQGSPLLVAYDFVHDLDRIRGVLGKHVPHIGGGVSAKAGAKIIEAWNRGDIPVLLAHPATLAHGVNLQQCGNHICWFSLTWNLEHYDQMIARIWRQGSKAKRVFVHHIIAKGTIDNAILGALHSKTKVQDALLDALKGRK